MLGLLIFLFIMYKIFCKWPEATMKILGGLISLIIIAYALEYPQFAFYCFIGLITMACVKIITN